jgi:hypothetical protein
MVFIAIILSLLFFSVCVLFYYLLDSVFGDLDFSTNSAVIKQISDIICQKNLGQAVLYDLGSARGNFVLKIADIFPNLKAYGIDNSWFRTNFARIRALLHPNRPKFVRQDIFKTDVFKADIVFMYLEQSLVSSLEEKLSRELKSGATVIINNTHFTHWPSSAFYQTDKKDQSRGKVFVYSKM